MKAKKKLQIEWQNGPWQDESAHQMRGDFSAMCESETAGNIQRDDGDLRAGFEEATQIVESEYFMPYLHHAPLEPFNCLADVIGTSATIITGHQFPEKIADNIDISTHMIVQCKRLNIRTVIQGF